MISIFCVHLDMPVTVHRDLEIFWVSDRAEIGEQLIWELGTQLDLSSENISFIVIFISPKNYLSSVEAGDDFDFLLNNIVYFLIQNNQRNTGKNVHENNGGDHGNRGVCGSKSQSKLQKKFKTWRKTLWFSNRNRLGRHHSIEFLLTFFYIEALRPELEKSGQINEER